MILPKKYVIKKKICKQQNLNKMKSEIIEYCDTELTIYETWHIAENEILVMHNCTLHFAPNTGIFSLGKIEAYDCVLQPSNYSGGWKGIADIGKGRSQFIRCHFSGGRGRELRELQDHFIGRYFREISDYEVVESWSDLTDDEREEAYSTTYGGAIISLNSLVKECRFEDCRVKQDGGAIIATLNVDIEECTFIRCRAGMDGGAVVMKESGSLKKSLFISCRAGNAGGGGFFDNSSIRILQCKFKNCVSRNGGGACAQERVRIKSSFFVKCISTIKGGGIYGPIHGDRLAFVQCASRKGGGAYLDNESYLQDGVFYRCHAKDSGGGLWSFVPHHAVIERCRFIQCIAGETAGGARIRATTVKMCEFKNNIITTKAPNELSADHLYSSGDSLIDRSTFIGNRFEQKKIPQFILFESIMLESTYDKEHIDSKISFCKSRVL